MKTSRDQHREAIHRPLKAKDAKKLFFNKLKLQVYNQHHMSTSTPTINVRNNLNIRTEHQPNI